MKSKFIQLVLISSLFKLLSTQFLSFPNWGDEDEGNDMGDENDSGEIWVLEEEENPMKLIKMSLSDIENEKRLLQKSSLILVNTVTSELRDELIETNMHSISDIISDHTVDVFNALQILEKLEEEKLPSVRIKKNIDIFLWNNNSIDRINEIIESFYNT